MCGGGGREGGGFVMWYDSFKLCVLYGCSHLLYSITYVFSCMCTSNVQA